jgi:3-deoxy-D-manno-octulosonate 8-phosphate phosphatase (KDO 8-P phosphatase)
VVSPSPFPRFVLTPVEVEARARRLKLVLTDCDGVLTDAGVYWSDGGEVMRRFSVRDGMGVELLRGAGIATAILSRELSPCVARRSEKLGLPHLFLGVQDKEAHFPRILEVAGVGAGEVAFIGDDVNDAALLARVSWRGLTAAPADAMPSVAGMVHYRCSAPGGHGAFREFAEWILEARGEARS